MQYPCAIKEQSAQPFLAIRVRTPVSELPALLGQSYGAIMAYLGEIGEQPAGVPFSGYYNQDMQDLDVAIGIPTAEIFKGRGEIYGAEIPAGLVAECLYTGPYNKLSSAYQQVAEFIAAKGVIPTGVAYEMYIDDPATTPHAEMRTLILFPLK